MLSVHKRMAMLDIPEDYSRHVEIIDCSISHYLRQEEVSKETLDHWLGKVNFNQTDVFIVPYNENGHWSLIGIDLLSMETGFMNSIDNTHGSVRL